MTSAEWHLIDFHPPSVMLLTLAVFVPLIWWRWLRAGRYAAVRFSTLEPLRQRGRTWAVRARKVIPLLRTVAVLLLIVCLARPRKGDEETRIVSEGIAIQLLVDRSSSMLAHDFSIDGQRVDRLTAVKAVAREFVGGNRNAGLAGRPDDLVGMIAFAGYADSKCPLTLDHGYLLTAVEQVEIVEGDRQEDGTAIGDAIGLGVERLRDLDKRRAGSEAVPIKNKVMILLTDGQQNRGDLSPQKAAEVARTFGIKIYTIGAGTKGMAPMPWTDMLGRKGFTQALVSIDEDTLRDVARITGGEYFRATDTDSLREVYARIDELEKTRTEEKRFLQYAELATQTVRVGGITWPPLLAVVLGLLALEVVLANTRLRKIP